MALARRGALLAACLPCILAGSCMLNTRGELAVSLDGAGQDASADSPAVDADATADGVDAHDTAPPDGHEAGKDTGSPEAETCVPPTDQDFCQSQGKNCGAFTAVDVCGYQRTAQCGSCAGASLCGGDLTNVCGSWWDCAWTRRQRLTMAAAEAVPAPHSIRVRFDHAALVTASASRADGNDIRILHRAGPVWTEVHRVLDPESAWNQAQTTLWFATAQAVAQGQSDSDYYLYYGNPGAGLPLSDEGQVFHFADFFDRADTTTVGNGWTLLEDATKINILQRELWFETTGDQSNRPVAEHGFAPLAGRVELRLGFHFVRSGAEGTYRLHMHLGRAAAMDNPPPYSNVWASAGVGPALVWAGPNQGMTDHEAFGYSQGNVAHQAAVATGAVPITVTIDIPSHTYSLMVGTTSVDALAFSSNEDSLDRVRLFTWQLNQAYFSSRGFSYVIVRSLLANEPSLGFGAEQQGSCSE